MVVLLKVCGMTVPAQVAAIDDMGADCLGFIFAGKSPRRVTPEAVAAMPRGRAKRVGVFVEQDADEVNRIMDVAGLDVAQLHGGQDEAFCRAVGPERVIKVFWPQRYAAATDGSGKLAGHPQGAEAADRTMEALRQDMARFADLCALMLLDAGTSGGGHGVSLDFASLSGLAAPKPWLLAGGLSPGNAADALALARPGGLDVNSGVESSPGIKDISKVSEILTLVKSF